MAESNPKDKVLRSSLTAALARFGSQPPAAGASNQILDGLSQLETRGGRIIFWAKWIGWVALGAAIFWLITGLAARYGFNPPTHLSSIDIPDAVLKAFSDSDPGSSGGGAMGAFQGSSQAIGSLLSILSKIAPIVGLVMGTLALLLGMGTPAIVMSVAIGTMPLLLSMMMGIATDGASQDSSDQTSVRDQFVQLVKNHDYDAITKELQIANMLTTSPGRYVLAQIAVARTDPALIASAASKLDWEPAPGFKPRPDVMYVLEKATGDGPLSPEVSTYVQKERWWKGAMSGASTGFGLQVGLLSACMMLLLALGKSMRKRASRIRHLYLRTKPQ